MKLTIAEIKKMASAWNQVQEAKKKKMDPVGKADADIDNDGDVDSSDEYLHKRRKAISKAMKGKQTETEVQESVELGESKDHVSVSYDYMGDGPGHPAKKEIHNHATKHGGSSMKITSVEHDGPGGGASEVTAKGHVKHAMKLINHHHDENYSLDHSGHKKYKKDYGIQESVELDENRMLAPAFHRVIKAHKYESDASGKNHTWPQGDRSTKIKHNGTHVVTYNQHDGSKVHKTPASLNKHLNALHDHEVDMKSVQESVELDELSKKTLGSYVKKASGDLQKSSGKAGYASGKGVDKSEYDKQTDRAEKRRAGISKATDKLTKEAKDHGNMNNGSPRGEGLSPSAKKELARTTPMNPATDEPMVNKKTFDAIRASGKKAPMRSNDNAAGEKNIKPSATQVKEDMDKIHTVDIDHMGGHDPDAKKHNITLKKNKGTDYSHDASGKKKDLQKYLAKHYGSAEDAKEIHPEVH